MESVDLSLVLTEKETADLYGPECDDFDPGCAVCQGWKAFHNGKPITLALERRKLVKAYISGDI